MYFDQRVIDIFILYVILWKIKKIYLILHSNANNPHGNL